ncbi:aspartate kinase [uncultured Holdemanella sp.]|uniref:aspartate kinase n=1 Tax=uncultured Holdemanella sp. TaxID=1763549 RepID=UPI0025DAFFEE|nr:aspartate kinase [uncultured Holdemanella sp.]
MLKNIVFDLGNVLVKFDSNELIYSFFNERQEEVKSFYFDSLWNEYDQGLYSVEEMIEKGVKQFPELELSIKKLMYHWTEFVIPLKDNVAYIKDLKRLGYNVYILSNIPEERELDVLLSCGEQISMAKLAILLNRLGMPAISLTGWQAGIYTNNTNQDAIIEDIDTTRITKELEAGKIVVLAGFQGINNNLDITTLGRGGSDTTAVAVAAKLKATSCYIFSDVDGIYTTDPNQTKVARKLDSLSYTEMLDIANEGAKVLHNRCVEVGEKFKIPIVAKSTFNNNEGTVINNKIEGSYVKNIVKNDNIQFVHITSSNKYLPKTFNNIYKEFIEEEIGVKNLVNSSEDTLDISFTIPKVKFAKLANLLENKFPDFESSYPAASMTPARPSWTPT